MKRMELVKKINDIAKSQGTTATWKEGSSHSIVTVGSHKTVVPRHKEIKEPLARQIIQDIQD